MTTAPLLSGLAARWTHHRLVRIMLPVLLLIGFIAAFLTREGPDYTIHSWVGIAVLPVIAIHLASNAGWIRRVWKRKRRHREFGLGVLNAAFAALAGICIATGFPIWLGWSDAAGWTATHMITGIASILVMLVHVWRNRARIRHLIRPRPKT